MKQKKAPTTLIAAVVVMLLLGGLVNATGFLQDPMRFFRSQEQPKETAPTTLTEAQKQQNKDMLKSVARKRKGGAEGRPGAPEEEMVNGVPKEPTILIPEIAIVKPQINDSNVSAQWYREESRQKKLADDKAKELSGSGQ